VPAEINREVIGCNVLVGVWNAVPRFKTREESVMSASRLGENQKPL
jgi:hypothetical protein